MEYVTMMGRKRKKKMRRRKIMVRKKHDTKRMNKMNARWNDESKDDIWLLLTFVLPEYDGAKAYRQMNDTDSDKN